MIFHDDLENDSDPNSMTPILQPQFYTDPNSTCATILQLTPILQFYYPNSTADPNSNPNSISGHHSIYQRCGLASQRIDDRLGIGGRYL